MAVLRLRAAGALAALALVGAAGCSAILDPEDLRPSGDAAVTDAASDAGGDPGGPGVEVSVAMPGAGACTLVYEEPPLACPRSCPSEGGWELVFDGSASTGVASWDWEFVASTGWVVREERDDDTARPTVVVDLDTPRACPTGYEVKAGSVTVRLGVNGGTRQVVGDLALAVTESSPCQPNQCAPPP